jgi:arylformamidase
MSQYIDITLEISNDMPVWEGDPPVEIKDKLNIRKGDQVNVKTLKMGSHTGTHIDAPRHFYKKGACIDEIKLKHLIGFCYVKTIKGRTIGFKDLTGIDFNKYKKIIFKTENTSRQLLLNDKFAKDFVSLSHSAAEELTRQYVDVVGIDYLSIESYHSDGSLHKTLLQKNVIVIEGLDLRKVKEGPYFLIALPLKIKKGDGAPSRVILQKV